MESKEPSVVLMGQLDVVCVVGSERLNHFYENLPQGLKDMGNQEAVAAYLAGADTLWPSVEGLTEAQLTSFPVPGTWSIKQIIFHLMDTDQVASYRMKRIIAEEKPTFDCYDESAFAAKLHCAGLDVRLACDAFASNRKATAAMLRELSEEEFERVANHPEVGPMSVGLIVRLYVAHLEHHMKFITNKRAMVTT